MATTGSKVVESAISAGRAKRQGDLPWMRDKGTPSVLAHP